MNKQKDILLDEPKQLELSHKLNPVLVLEKNSNMQSTDLLEAKEIYRKLDFIKQKYFEKSNVRKITGLSTECRIKVLLLYLEWNQTYFHNERDDVAIHELLL